MKRVTRHLIIVISLMVLSAVSAQADTATAALGQSAEPELILSLRRDFGYGGFGEIQGTFRLTVSGPENLARVAFLLDDQILGEATEAPWQLRFHTDNFSPGSHTLAARGYTEGGDELYSNEIHTRFLSSQEAGQATTRLIVILLGGILGLMAISALISTLLFRRKGSSTPSGAARHYGLAGGAVCSRCGRPFARHLSAPNMVLGKLERCPYCGKWGILRAASRAELAAAEAAELQQSAASGQAAVLPEDDRLRRDLEDSRYEG